MNNEQKFFGALKDIFIGVPLEGESGYINLMRIKARYFEQAIKLTLQSKIDQALQPFPDFREELFDKLYTFFKRYFIEGSSIGFFFTPYHQSVYEQVYTDDRDVMLFWKTARLYYVKTDRLFRSMNVTLNGFRFFFDVSTLVYKRANEKRELDFAFKERRGDDILVFTVIYSEKGAKTRADEIRRAIKNELRLKKYTDAIPSEEVLEHAFRLFERQSEVDYFICKNAKSFLREQFDLWIWQYLLGKPGEEPRTEWTELRLKQLQALKCIAYRIIDFIAAFEDELCKIWNKPKFVLCSHYVITLDRIAERKPELVERLIVHPGLSEQVREWEELGFVEEGFTPDILWENNLLGRHLSARYYYLPIDTRYFKDLELQILALFDNLDEALDGWLIKSENYQALNTILPKFKGEVQTVYIDPPFNKEQDADYHYSVKYKDATWITFLKNRLQLAKDILKDTGSIFVRCDYNGNMYVRLLMNEIFGEKNFRNEIDIERNQSLPKTGGLNLVEETENLIVYAVDDGFIFANQLIDRENPYWGNLGTRPSDKKTNPSRIINGIEFKPPEYRRWSYSQQNLDEMYKNKRLKIEDDKLKVLIDKKRIGSNWTRIRGYSATPIWGFSTENSEDLLSRVIDMSSKKSDIIMDFFLGIGTTTAVAHKLRRKWIGVEMENIFYSFQPEKGKLSGILVRMKEVLAGRGNHEPSGISKKVGWQGGGFFKYYELEQYEDTLQRACYLENDLFIPLPTEDPCQYLFLRDPKMLQALEMDLEQGKVEVDLSKLYNDIDTAETLSNLKGKWMRRIHPDPDEPISPAAVEFSDGTMVELKNPDWRLIKPLIWW